MSRALTVRTVLLGALGVVTLLCCFPALLPSLLPQLLRGFIPPLVCLICLTVGCAVSWPTVRHGLKGLWERPAADSFVVLNCGGALLQNLALLGRSGAAEATAPFFSAAALLALLANAMGKRLLSGYIRDDFEQMTDDARSWQLAELAEDMSFVRRMTHGLEEKEPCLLLNRPSESWQNFMDQCFVPHAADRTAQRPCQLLVGAALLGGILGALLGSGFVLPFAAILCGGCPLAMILCSAVPYGRMHAAAKQMGAVMPGANTLEQLEQTNTLTVDVAELFPRGSVILKGLKTFGEPRIDLAILYAASLLVPGCATLRGIFLEILQNRTELLPEVEQFSREPGCGLEGFADGKHLLVGNRGMMVSHGVEVPPPEYEEKHTRAGRYCPVYLAVNGRLTALFVVGYHADENVLQQMREAYVSGLSLLVCGEDFNLSGDRIDRIYGLPSGCIKVLGAAESAELAKAVAPCRTGRGVLAHGGLDLHGMMACIRLAAAAYGAEKLSALLCSISALFTALLLLVLTCTGGLGVLTLPAVLLYQLFWLALTLVIPLLHRT